jgi:hypothetical protein
LLAAVFRSWFHTHSTKTEIASTSSDTINCSGWSEKDLALNAIDWIDRNANKIASHAAAPAHIIHRFRRKIVTTAAKAKIKNDAGYTA